MPTFGYESCTMALSLRHILYFGNTNKTCEKIRTNKFSIVWLHIFTTVHDPFSKLKWENSTLLAECGVSPRRVYSSYQIYNKKSEIASTSIQLSFLLVPGACCRGKKVEVHLNPATRTTSQHEQHQQCRPLVFHLLLLHVGVPTKTLHAIDVWPLSAVFGSHCAWSMAMRHCGALLVVGCPQSVA